MKTRDEQPIDDGVRVQKKDSTKEIVKKESSRKKEPVVTALEKNQSGRDTVERVVTPKRSSSAKVVAESVTSDPVVSQDSKEAEKVALSEGLHTKEPREKSMASMRERRPDMSDKNLESVQSDVPLSSTSKHEALGEHDNQSRMTETASEQFPTQTVTSQSALQQKSVDQQRYSEQEGRREQFAREQQAGEGAKDVAQGGQQHRQDGDERPRHRQQQWDSGRQPYNNYRSRPQQQQGGGGQQQHQQRHKDQQQKSSAQKPQQEQVKVPLKELSLQDLNVYARKLGIIGATLMTKAALIERITHVEANPDMEMKVEGVLEKLPDGFGFLRSPQFDYVSGPDDVYVSPSQIRRFNLKTGDMVTGVIRKPKEGEKYFALLKVDAVNYEDPAKTVDRMSFEQLTPLHPDKKFNLELEHDPKAISTRIMDIFTPIGKGQRGLIVAPPKVGKTVLLKEIVKSLIVNYPDDHLIVLLIDERPEEVTDMRKAVEGSKAEVVSSTFDESAERHVQVAELVLEKAKRLVEMGRSVIILLDAITRLARAYNTTAPASGKVLTGGIDANALQRPKRFFGAARNTQEGGSLTIIATALVDTGSRMDEVIYEEFKGTGNMEIHMTRKLSNRRMYPAFDLMQSGTRRDDLLIDAEDLNKIWVLQKFLATMNTVEGMEFLIDKIKKTKNNREFIDVMNKKAGSTPSGSGSSGAGSSSGSSSA